MLTSVDVEKDPQLKSMLWDDVVAALEKSADEYNALFKDASAKVVATLSNAFAVYFARHQVVDALAFSLTEAEYDDESYGGYDFTEIRPRFVKDLLTTTEAQEFVNSFDEYFGGFTETHFYGFGRMECPAELAAAINEANELNRLLDRITAFARINWGDCGIVVTRDKIAKYHDQEDLQGWAKNR